MIGPLYSNFSEKLTVNILSARNIVIELTDSKTKKNFLIFFSIKKKRKIDAKKISNDILLLVRSIEKKKKNIERDSKIYIFFF